jgi:membrane protein
MKNDDAALSELSPRSGSATSPPRRERWLVRSILLGVNRAAGLATAALHVGAFIVWLRSPLSMAMGSMRIYAITAIIAIALCAWLLRPKRLRTSNYFFSTTLLLFIATFILNQNVRSEVVSFTSSSSTVPSVAGWLLAGWAGVVITAVSCMLLQARDKRELLRRQNTEDASKHEVGPEEDCLPDDALESEDSRPTGQGRIQTTSCHSRAPRRKRAKRLCASAAGALTVALAATAPSAVNHHLDPLIQSTTKAANSQASFPTVDDIRAKAADQSSVQEPTWERSLGDTRVDQLLTGKHNAVAVTSKGLYGISRSTGDLTWCFATTSPNILEYDALGRTIENTSIYADKPAFTSPDGTWLAYAIDMTPKSSHNTLTRIVILRTDNGEVAVDTQVSENVPTVQLTDSMVVINRKVYDLTSGKELDPLDAAVTVVPGPGGHANVLVKTDNEQPEAQSKTSVESLPETYLRASSDNRYKIEHQSLKRAWIPVGDIITSGGWIVTYVDDNNELTAQNIDSGSRVPLTGPSTNFQNVLQIEASQQAISVWTVDTEPNQELNQASTPIYPVSLSVFDTRSGKSTTIDSSGLYRSTKRADDSRSSSTEIDRAANGAVDTPQFFLQTESYDAYYGKLAIRMGDDGGDQSVITTSDGRRLPWVRISIESPTPLDTYSLLSPEGMMITAEKNSISTLAGRKLL